MKKSKTKPGLLDVNVLIALIDPAHEFHAPAHLWFQRNRTHGWATCPITENGCLRLLSKPGYPFPGLTVGRVRDILAGLVGAEGHRFWPDSVSLLQPKHPGPGLIDLSQTTPKHLTDLYLVSLAIAHRGRLVTFDRAIPVRAIAGFRPHHIEVLAAEP